MSYTEIPTELLLDIHELVVECNAGLKVDGWEGTATTTMDAGVTKLLRPITKWLEYQTSILARNPELGIETHRRLNHLQLMADDALAKRLGVTDEIRE